MKKKVMFIEKEGKGNENVTPTSEYSNL